MKRLILILIFALTIVTDASCQNVRRLVRQVRQGEVQAYESLAICYRDGVKVEKSWLNMLCVYETYCVKTGKDVREIVKDLDAIHPYRLLTEILYMTSVDERAMKLLSEIRTAASLEAEAVDVFLDLNSGGDQDTAASRMRVLAEKGSELAVIYLTAYYEQTNEKQLLMDFYEVFAQRYPVFYLLSGEMYVKQYHEDGDFANIEKAMDYYYKADKHGMLTPKFAYGLWSTYDYFGKKGMLKIKEKEIDRLQKIAQTVK